MKFLSLTPHGDTHRGGGELGDAVAPARCIHCMTLPGMKWIGLGLGQVLQYRLLDTVTISNLLVSDVHKCKCVPQPFYLSSHPPLIPCYHKVYSLVLLLIWLYILFFSVFEIFSMLFFGNLLQSLFSLKMKSFIDNTCSVFITSCFSDAYLCISSENCRDCSASFFGLARLGGREQAASGRNLR